MKLSVTQKTFEFYLVELGFNYKIIQYKILIQTIRTIIFREIQENILSNSLINYLDSTFIKYPPIIIFNNQNIIDDIKEEYLLNLINSGRLDLHFKDINKKYSKDIQIQAYQIKLIKERNKPNRDFYLSLIKYKKLVKQCLNENYFTLSETEILELTNSKTFIIPTDQEDLEKIIKKSIEILGNNADLNFINTSNIIDMSYLFSLSRFNGDISEWDTSSVKYINNMFESSDFNGDISNWDTSNVINMIRVFPYSKFNQDILNWDTSNVVHMSAMFRDSNFNQDISTWNTSKVKYMNSMFKNSPFNKNISDWDFNSLTHSLSELH